MTISRRKFLRGTAVAGAVGATVAAPAVSASPGAVTAAEPWREENPALINAWKLYRAAEKEYVDAKDALEWLADEWKHVWPLAPEDLLGACNMHKYDPFDSAERDIVGRPLMRDIAVLRTQMSAKQRAQGGQQCFAVRTSEELMEDLARWRLRKPTGRTEKCLIRKRAEKADIVRRLRQKIRLARQYEAETARLREAARVEDAKGRRKVAEENLDALAHRVSMERPLTMYGVRLQADVVISTLERYRITAQNEGIFGETMRLVCNVMDATAHLAGGGAA